LKDLIFFWKRRWFRTLPNYFLVLGFNVLVFVILGKSLPDNTWLYVPFLQNFLNAHPNFFTEAWSLSVEEYAYLILPFILYLFFYLFKKNQNERLFIRVTLIIILALFLLKLNYFFNTEINSYKEWSSTFRKVVVYRIDSIYWGFVLVYLIKKYPINIKKFKNYFLIIGLFLLVGIHVVILKMNLLPSTNLGFYVFVYLQVVILSLGFVFPFCININYTGFFVKTTQFISVHSYSIYLVNYSIILLTIQNNLNIESMTIFQKGMMVFIFLALTIFSSMIIYRYFELPILRYRDSKFKRIVK
jgi:peptidoglycan/LPS O-acetylase OafA/YrhL